MENEVLKTKQKKKAKKPKSQKKFFHSFSREKKELAKELKILRLLSLVCAVWCSRGGRGLCWFFCAGNGFLSGLYKVHFVLSGFFCDEKDE